MVMIANIGQAAMIAAASFEERSSVSVKQFLSSGGRAEAVFLANVVESQTSRSRQPLSKITCQDPEVLAVDKSQFVWLDRGASPCVAALRPTSFQAERSGPALRGTRSAKRPRPPTGPQAG